MEEETASQKTGEGGEEGQVVRKRTAAGRGTPSKKKRRQEDGTQLLKVLLSSPSLLAEQVQEKITEELDNMAQVQCTAFSCHNRRPVPEPIWFQGCFSTCTSMDLCGRALCRYQWSGDRTESGQPKMRTLIIRTLH